ncbi:MAG: ssl1498 family light-harvesting-like protein [Elainellaceae cyanobacterium]
MSYSTDAALDFRSIARELNSTQGQSLQSDGSNGSELVPGEAQARMIREGGGFLRRPGLNGSTVDQEGLTNNYAVEPNMYYSVFPSPEQARQYALQGAAATLLIVGLVLTSVVVS